MTFCTEIEKLIPKSYGNTKKSQKAKAIVSKKSNSGGIILTNFKLYYRAITIKTAWYWHKNRHGKPMDQNRRPRHKPTHLQCN
jgi:hypothetical protein